MGKSSPAPPAPPDPSATAQAQTGTNVGTAVAQTILGNANQYGPSGSTEYNQIGSQSISVPTFDAQGHQTGTSSYDIPRYSQTTTLSPAQQQMYDLQNQTGLSLNQTALSQAGQIGNLLNNPVSQADVGAMAALPGQATFQGAPTSPTFQQQGAGSPLTMSSPAQQADTTFGASGPIQMSVGPNDYSADRQNVVNAIYSRLNPELDRERSSLENSLVNQGFQRGTQAFDEAMNQYGRQANDAYMQADLAGSNEQSRLAGLALQQGQFANSAQQQDYTQQQGRGLFGLQATGQNNASNLAANQFANSAAGQAFSQDQSRLNFNNTVGQQGYQNDLTGANLNNQNAQQTFANQQANASLQNQEQATALQQLFGVRSFPINQITALMSGGQVQSPSATPYQSGNIGQTNVSGDVYNTAALNQANYQSQVAQQNAMMGGLFGLGSSAILGAARFSDRRLKRNIVDLGLRLTNGLKLYAYRYLWSDEPKVGVMADEVMHIKPSAVSNIGGYLAVDYDQALTA